MIVRCRLLRKAHPVLGFYPFYINASLSMVYFPAACFFHTHNYIHFPLLLPGNPESFLFLPLPYPPRWAIKIPRKHVRSRGIPTFPILLYFLCAVSCAQSLSVIAAAAADTVSTAVLLLPASSPRLPPVPGSSPALPARIPIRGIHCSP